MRSSSSFAVGAFANAGSFIGRVLTVSFCGSTAAGVPRCGNGIAVGAAEDIPIVA
jgi:hypothetical protein